MLDCNWRLKVDPDWTKNFKESWNFQKKKRSTNDRMKEVSASCTEDNVETKREYLDGMCELNGLSCKDWPRERSK